jgi:N-methylhydantoinase B/oxoprolinase/acetone carboxylase alpha subunit
MVGADPILASVLQRRVQAISREMATVLMRTSRSPIFNEIGDLVTVATACAWPGRRCVGVSDGGQSS